MFGTTRYEAPALVVVQSAPWSVRCRFVYDSRLKGTDWRFFLFFLFFHPCILTVSYGVLLSSSSSRNLACQETTLKAHIVDVHISEGDRQGSLAVHRADPSAGKTITGTLSLC